MDTDLEAQTGWGTPSPLVQEPRCLLPLASLAPGCGSEGAKGKSLCGKDLSMQI